MKISTKHYGASGNKPASILEVTVETNSSIVTEDLAGMDKRVPTDFIQQLRDIADELEAHNGLVFEEENGIEF